MKARQTKITIELTIEEGIDIRNQILKLAKDPMELHAGSLKDTALKNLYDILSANFVDTHKHINFT